MRFYLLLCVLAVPVLCAPEGYKYREPAPVIEKHGLQSVLPPCKHAGGYKFDASTLALIQSQSQARIVNQKNQHIAEHNLEAAASGYSTQTHAGALSNQIGSGVGGKGSIYPGSSNAFHSGISTSVPKPPVNYIPVSQGPAALPLQSQTQSYTTSQGQGYNYNQAISSQNIKQNHQINVPAVHPVPPRPGPFGSFAPGQLSSVRPNHAAQYAGQQSSSHSSSQFGTQLSSASNYNPTLVSGHSSINNFGGQASANNFGPQQFASNFGTSNYAPQFGSSNLGGHLSNSAFDTYSSSSHGADALNGQLGHVIRETVANAPLDPSADKHIYVHVPPEDLERDNEAASLSPQFLAPPKKHYKIVFIKAPSHQTPNYGQLAAAAAPKVEEKTLIYVLVKKPDQPSLDDLQQIQQSSYKTSKPEVYFIKYKTQKEGIDERHNAALATSGSALSSDQIELTTSNPIEQIDIRSGAHDNNGAKHELYGVPLQ